MNETLYTVAEVAEHYKLHRKTILRRIKAGKLPAIKVGRAYRIKADDMKLLEQQP